MTSSHGLSVRRFSTDAIPAAERHEAWRTQGWPSVAQICDFEAAPGFFADTETIALPPATIIDGRYGAQAVHRTPPLIRREPVDHLHITIPAEAPIATPSGVAAPGAAIVIDLAQEWQHRAETGAMTTIVVPRAVAYEHGIDPRRAHGTLLSPTAATLLRAHVDQVVGQAAIIPAEVATRLVGTTVDLVAVALAMQGGLALPTPEGRDGALKTRALRLMASGLEHDWLTTDHLIARLATSRSHLYKLFEAEGGVQRAIRRQRLLAAKAALTDSTDQIRTIGERYRFSEIAHFSRAFREEFGVSPSEWRAASRRD